MLSRLRLILTGLFLSMALIACSDESATSNEAAEDTAAPEEMNAAPEMDAADEMGAEGEMDAEGALQTEQDYIDAYGEPDITQERQIDDLKIVHHEWDTDEGIVSIQVHNDEVAFSQVTPK